MFMAVPNQETIFAVLSQSSFVIGLNKVKSYQFLKRYTKISLTHIWTYAFYQCISPALHAGDDPSVL